MPDAFDPEVQELSREQLNQAMGRLGLVRQEEARQRQQEQARRNEVRATEKLDEFSGNLKELLARHNYYAEPFSMAGLRKLYLDLLDMVTEHTEELDAENIPSGFLFGVQR